MNSRRAMNAVIWSLQPEGQGKDSSLIGPCPGFTPGTTSHRHPVHGFGPR